MHSFCIFIHCAICTKIARKFCLFCLLTMPRKCGIIERVAGDPNPAPRSLYGLFLWVKFLDEAPHSTPEMSTGRDRPDGAVFHLDPLYALFLWVKLPGPGDPAIPENLTYMRPLDK